MEICSLEIQFFFAFKDARSAAPALVPVALSIAFTSQPVA